MTTPQITNVGGIDIEVLEIVADWREDLTQRVRRARLRYELVGLPPEAVIDLSRETEDFRRTCAALRSEWGPA